MDTRRDVFQAIADPTRRQIIGLLANGPMNINALSEKFDITRQAVSLQIKILEECGMVVVTQTGRERLCAAQLDGLDEVSQWIEQYKEIYERKLDALEAYMDKIKKTKRYAQRKK